ncbi:hypothetical protein F-VV10_0095 [Faustovirus]|nr:hypothetical protein F-VV10_0095 [Faustovirus]
MLTRPGKFQDINIGVKIIPVETHQNYLTPNTNLLLRGCERDLCGVVCIISESNRAREISKWCESTRVNNAAIKSISIMKLNSLFDDAFRAETISHSSTIQPIDTLILYPGIQLGKEVGFRSVKQTMTMYNYTEVGPAHIRMLLRIQKAIPGLIKRVILITTLSFLTCSDKQYVALRRAFLAEYKITKMTACNDCIDSNNTLITLVADLCEAVDSLQPPFNCTVWPNNVSVNVDLRNPLFTIAYEYHEFVNYKSRYVVFSRYVDNDKSQDVDIAYPCVPTNLYLNSVDCANKSISMEIKEPVLGKSTDRMGCTIVANVRILPYVDKLLCDKFNEFITNMREKYCSLFLVNFRGVINTINDANASPGPRKRIPYNAVYAILGRFFDSEIMEKGITGNLPKILHERNHGDPQFERLMANYKKNQH